MLTQLLTPRPSNARLPRRLPRRITTGRIAPRPVGFGPARASAPTPAPLSIASLIEQWIDANPAQLYRGGA